MPTELKWALGLLIGAAFILIGPITGTLFGLFILLVVFLWTGARYFIRELDRRPRN